MSLKQMRTSIGSNGSFDGPNDDVWDDAISGGSPQPGHISDADSISNSPIVITAYDEDQPCEFGCGVAPESCQQFRNSYCILIWLCLAAFTQGLVVNGFVNSVITSLEKRFNLLSSESGTIASMYDIAVLICLVPVSYIGGKMNKARWISVGLVIMGLGSFVFTIPHFVEGNYEFEKRNHPVCSVASDSNTSYTFCNAQNRNVKLRVNNYKYVFWFGQFLHGVGASPIYTLGVTFLDENLSAKSAALFLGIFYTMSLIGPAIGYVLGGVFLGIYVDVNEAAPGIKPENRTVWVGAWWIGFLLSGVLSWIGVIPMFGFPNSLPGSHRLLALREDETYHGDSTAVKETAEEVDNRQDDVLKERGAPFDFQHGFKDIVVAAKTILTNPVFILLSLSGASEIAIGTGVSTFCPKFLESAFGVTPDWSPILVGLCSVPAGGLGMFLGGLTIKVGNLKMISILKMCIGFAGLVLPFFLCFLLYCETPPMAGVTAAYNSHYLNGTLDFKKSMTNLTATCNANCSCSTDFYFYRPVCGSDNLTYFSPCHAGCDARLNDTYINCACTQTAQTAWSIRTAIDGACPADCFTKKITFLVLLCFLIFGTFFTHTPSLTATLRCVPQKQRSFAIGIQWIFLRLLGSIPGPLIFGALIDTTCSLWKSQCNAEGSCVFYDPKKFRVIFLGTSFVLKLASIVFLVFAAIMYKHRFSKSDKTSKGKYQTTGMRSSLADNETTFVTNTVS